jgi:histidine triad (HIT) family protein
MEREDIHHSLLGRRHGPRWFGDRGRLRDPVSVEAETNLAGGDTAQCTFCDIVARRRDAEIILETDDVVAFMDLLPMTHGHCLVIPKAHRKDLLDLAADDGRHLINAAQSVSRALMQTMDARGINLINNMGADADQTQFHFHLHVVPRYGGDRLLHPWERRFGHWPTVQEHAAKLRIALGQFELRRMELAQSASDEAGG